MRAVLTVAPLAINIAPRSLIFTAPLLKLSLSYEASYGLLGLSRTNPPFSSSRNFLFKASPLNRMAPKAQSSRPKTYWIGQSKVDDEVLASLVKEGLINDVSKVRLPGEQETPEPANDEAVVFVHCF